MNEVEQLNNHIIFKNGSFANSILDIEKNQSLSSLKDLQIIMQASASELVGTSKDVMKEKHLKLIQLAQVKGKYGNDLNNESLAFDDM